MPYYPDAFPISWSIHANSAIVDLLVVRSIEEYGPNRALLWFFTLYVFREIVIAFNLEREIQDKILMVNDSSGEVSCVLLSLIDGRLMQTAVRSWCVLHVRATKGTPLVWQRQWSQPGKDCLS